MLISISLEILTAPPLHLLVLVVHGILVDSIELNVVHLGVSIAFVDFELLIHFLSAGREVSRSFAGVAVSISLTAGRFHAFGSP